MTRTVLKISCLKPLVLNNFASLTLTQMVDASAMARRMHSVSSNIIAFTQNRISNKARPKVAGYIYGFT
jgi:1,4-dihydroxy-2-naphthoyl-CoA synthase